MESLAHHVHPLRDDASIFNRHNDTAATQFAFSIEFFHERIELLNVRVAPQHYFLRGFRTQSAETNIFKSANGRSPIRTHFLVVRPSVVVRCDNLSRRHIKSSRQSARLDDYGTTKHRQHRCDKPEAKDLPTIELRVRTPKWFLDQEEGG